MKKIAIVNHKGGVGKTTTTLNLGAELARRGKRVLLIDFDMQSNLTQACNKGIKADDITNTIADGINAIIAEQEPDYGAIIRRVSNISEDLYLVPCNLEMGNTLTLMQIQDVIIKEKCLIDFISGIGDDIFDYCLIDCAPSVLLDFQNALVASDSILIVSSPDTLSESGINSLMRSYSRVKKKFDTNITIAGMLINNVDTRTSFARAMSSALREIYQVNVFNTYIPRSIRVQESVVEGLSIKDYEPNNPVSRAFTEFAEEFIERMEKCNG